MRVVTEIPKVNGLRATYLTLEAESLTDERILGALTALTYYGGVGTVNIPHREWGFSFTLEADPSDPTEEPYDELTDDD
jgi:hypothetical protein